VAATLALNVRKSPTIISLEHADARGTVVVPRASCVPLMR
jgi:hypothetical protein